MASSPQAEIESLRQALIEADARTEAVRDQLSAAKTRAKAVIAAQRERAAQELAEAHENARVQDEELELLKGMVRSADSERERAVEAVRADARSLENRLAVARKSADAKINALTEDNMLLQAQLNSLKDEIETLKKKRNEEKITDQAHGKGTENVGSTEKEEKGQDIGISELVQKLASLKERVGRLADIFLEKQNEQERHVAVPNRQRIVQNLGKETPAANAEDEDIEPEARAKPSDDGDVLNYLSEIFEELQSAKEQTTALTGSFSKTQKDTAASKESNDKVIQKLNADLAETENRRLHANSRIEALEAEIDELRRNVSLERSKNEEFQKKQKEGQAVPSLGDEEKKILQAKISEMERVVNEKQVEIGRVREKARVYLKEINSEKRAIESKMTEEAATLRKQVEEEKSKVISLEQRMEAVDSELESCLSLVSEKQKNIQMLNMSLVTERESTSRVSAEVGNIREEFSKYKERARTALQERDLKLAVCDSAVEKATASLRAELSTTNDELIKLKKQLSGFQKVSDQAKAYLDRAVRAEAAVDLLRLDSENASSENVAEIDRLEASVAKLQLDLVQSEAKAKDAESRLIIATSRLRGAEESATKAEIQIEEESRKAEKANMALREKIRLLEQSLHKSTESAHAAQRVAAVAARALSEPTQSSLNVGTAPSIHQSTSPETSNAKPDLLLLPNQELLPEANSSSLAAVMSSHAFSLEGGDNFLSPRAKGASQKDNENQARDRQIAVLTSQLSELGTLLDDAQEEAQARSVQTDLLKKEVRELGAKLEAAQKMQNGAPFSYLRSIVVRYLETNDPRLLPVVADVLKFTDEELERVNAKGGYRGSTSSANGQPSGFFSLPFLGQR